MLNCCLWSSVDGGWTPWSLWSDCPVTCGKGKQIRTRACINPPPRNNGTYCTGPERDTQDCHAGPCLGTEIPFTLSLMCVFCDVLCVDDVCDVLCVGDVCDLWCVVCRWCVSVVVVVSLFSELWCWCDLQTSSVFVWRWWRSRVSSRRRHRRDAVVL